jgi:hypothetical protein
MCIDCFGTGLRGAYEDEMGTIQIASGPFPIRNQMYIDAQSQYLAALSAAYRTYWTLVNSQIVTLTAAENIFVSQFDAAGDAFLDAVADADALLVP